MIETIVLVVWTFGIIISVPRIFRGTLLDIRTENGQWWPLWLYQEFLLVMPAPILLAMFGVAAFPTTLLVVKDSQTFAISVLVLYAVTFFFVTVALCIRVIPKRLLEVGGMDASINYQRMHRFACVVTLIGLSIMLYGILFLNFHNSLIDVLMTGKSLNTVRIANKYETGLPSQLQFAISVAAWIVILHSGYSYAMRHRLKSLIFIVVGIVLAGADGGKGPILQVILLAGTAYLVVGKKRFNPKLAIIMLFLGIPVFFFTLYFVVSLQIPDLSLSGVIDYFVDRVGMAQMAGTYDGIALGNLQGPFFWHMVPFASQLVHYIPYDKLLMMRIEGYDFLHVGVKNSFFISEAFGIGGYGLVLASPFIVGFSWVISTAMTFLTMKRMFGRDVAGLYYLPLSILYLNVTGGFSPFPFFKGYLLMVAVLGIFWIPYFLISFLPRKNTNRNNVVVAVLTNVDDSHFLD